MTAARRCVLAAAAAVAALAGCRGASGGDPKVTLRYHPPAGAAYHYALEQQSSWTVESRARGQVPGPDITLHIYYTQAVSGPAPGGIGVTVTYDSTTMDPSTMAPALDRMRGLTSRVVYDDRGNVVSASFTGLEGEPSPLVDQLQKSVKGMAFPLPERPVGVGDSWTSDDEPLGGALGANAPLKARTRFTVKQIQTAGVDTTVLVAVERTFPGDPVTLETSRQGKRTVRLSGKLTGERLFSLAKSVPVRSTMGGTIKIEVRGGQSGAEATTVSQHSSLQLTGAN